MSQVEQFTLFGGAIPVGAPPYRSRQAQFDAFDAAHPAIYGAFVREARRFLAGKRQVAAVAILSLIRPQVSWDVDPAMRYRVSNTFAPLLRPQVDCPGPPVCSGVPVAPSARGGRRHLH